MNTDPRWSDHDRPGGDAAPFTPVPDPFGRIEARARFVTAATGAPPTEEQRSNVADIQSLVIDLAAAINVLVPDGRNKSLALTALEDVQMRANRGIFTDGGAV